MNWGIFERVTKMSRWKLEISSLCHNDSARLGEHLGEFPLDLFKATLHPLTSFSGSFFHLTAPFVQLLRCLSNRTVDYFIPNIYIYTLFGQLHLTAFTLAICERIRSVQLIPFGDEATIGLSDKMSSSTLSRISSRKNQHSQAVSFCLRSFSKININYTNDYDEWRWHVLLWVGGVFMYMPTDGICWDGSRRIDCSGSRWNITAVRCSFMTEEYSYEWNYPHGLLQ